MPDLSGTTADVLSMPAGPALSSTSDAPVIDNTAPETGSGPSPDTADTPAAPPADGSAGEAAAEAEGDAASAEQPAVKSKQPFSERLSEVVAQRRAAEERANRAVEAAAALGEQVKSLLAQINQPKPESAPPVQEVARPDRNDFDNPGDYDQALIDWAAERAARRASDEALRAAEQRAAEQKAADESARAVADQAKQNEATAREWGDRRAKAIEAHPDYAEIAERDDLQITVPMAHAIINADSGPEIAYWLGKNPEEAARIAALDHPVRQAIEIGKIAAAIAAPPKVEVSRAPRPIPRTVGNNANAGPKDPREMTTEEYAAQRMPQLQAERRASTLGMPPRQ